MKNKYFLLFVALLLGAFLRFYHIGSLPNSLTWDEAALGYNAFSILKTGRDEFGKILPLIFKSFGDYKPGFYIYLAVPSIAIFGLTEFAVRLPSAISGILAIWGIYLLVKLLFKKSPESHLLASCSSLILAISPWHIHFSRGAWETNVFSTLLLFSVYFLVKYAKEGDGLNQSLIFGALTFITYQAGKMLTPLVIGLVILLYWRDLAPRVGSYFKNLRNRTLFIVVLLSVFVIFANSLTGLSGNRLKRLSIFNYHPEPSQLTKYSDQSNSFVLNIFHGNSELMSRMILGRYLKHLSPTTLLYESGATDQRGHIPGMGLMMPFDFIFLFLGLYYLAKNITEKHSMLIVGIVLLSPIPASLTLSEYSSVRSLFMVIPLSIICGLGVYQATRYRALTLISGALSIFSFVYFLDLYYYHANFTFAREFQYGYREAISFYKQYPDSHLVMTDVFGQPYIFYLFYTRYDPREYQKNNHFVDGGLDVGYVPEAGNAEFHQFGRSEVVTAKNTVFVGTVGNIKPEFDFKDPNIATHQDVFYPGGEIMFRLIKTK